MAILSIGSRASVSPRFRGVGLLTQHILSGERPCYFIQKKQRVRAGTDLEHYTLSLPLVKGGIRRLRKRNFLSNTGCIAKLRDSKGEQFVRLARIHFGQAVADKVQGRLFQHSIEKP
jgi:hypothetical protein